MEPEAVAIRLDPLRVAPQNLIGTSPIVIFAEQGLAGANLEDAALPAAPRGGPGAKHQIDELIVVIDISSSMARAVSPGSGGSKLEHIRDELSRIGKDFFPESRLSIVLFNHKAVRATLGTEHHNFMVRRLLDGVTPSGGTDFEQPLKHVASILSGPDQTAAGRKVLLFITDGENGGDREKAAAIASTIKEHNAASYLIATGADPDFAQILELTQKLGFAGWGHTPAPPEPELNVFRSLIPAFLAQIQDADHYLQVEAETPLAAFYGVTPSIRPVDSDRVLNIGYWNSGMGVAFSQVRDPALRLKVAQYHSDPDAVVRDIPVIDYADAGAHFEKREFAAQQIGPILVTLAQLNRDMDLIRALRGEYPELRERIEKLAANAERQDPSARADTLSDLSGLSNLGASRVIPVNALSNVPVPRRIKPQQAGPVEAPEHLHSGGIGPLTWGTVGSIPELGRVDPEAYRRAIPHGHAKLEYTTWTGPKQFDLFKLQVGQVLVIGRGGCAIMIDDSGMSRRHLQIRRDTDGFYAMDLGSTNGTRIKHSGGWFKRGVKGEVKLQDGDRIFIGNTELTFRE